MPMETAPRDGKIVLVRVKGYPSYASEWIKARVVPTWATDEFIPVDIPFYDTAGMNHGAIHEQDCMGWMPA